MLVDVVFHIVNGEKVWISADAAYKLDGNEYFCPDGHRVTIVADEATRASGADKFKKSKHARHLPGTVCHLTTAKEPAYESTLHSVCKELIAADAGVKNEIRYPNSDFVADAGCTETDTFHEVVVHHHLGVKKAEFIQKGLYDGTIATVYLYNAKDYFKKRFAVQDLRFCRDDLLELGIPNFL